MEDESNMKKEKASGANRLRSRQGGYIPDHHIPQRALWIIAAVKKSFLLFLSLANSREALPRW
jgi:hypothetical protein